MDADDSRHDALRSGLRPALRPIAQAAFVFAGAVLLLVLAGVLPGVTDLTPDGTDPLPSLLLAVVGLLAAGALVVLSGRVETSVEASLDGPTEVVSRLGVIAANVVLLLALLVGYAGAGLVATPVLEPVDAVWLFEVAVVVLALGPLAMIGHHLNRNLDPAADLLVAYLASVIGIGSDGTR